MTLNDEIKTKVADSMLSEETTTMAEIWQRHKEATKDIHKTASKLHTFMSVVSPGHGLKQEDIEDDPKSHEHVLTAIAGHSMSKGERDEFRKHVDDLKDANHRRQTAIDDHENHDSFNPTIGKAIKHGVFGKSGSSLSSSLSKAQDASRTAMERHSKIDANSMEAHKLRQKHGAVYDVSKVTKKKSNDDDEGDNGILKSAARTIGHAALSTLINTNQKGRRR